MALNPSAILLKKFWKNIRREGTKFRLGWVVAAYNLRHRFPFIAWPFYLLGLALILVVFALTTLVVSIELGYFGKLPDRHALAGITHYTASEVLADDGSLLGRYYFENRINVAYNNISPHFIQALLATEDVRYFQHNGIDLRSWARVLFKTLILKERSAGGGSTLSQQLAKNIYPRERYPYASLLINKIREVLIARRLELLYTKEEILELYLNTVSFSENTYGIKVAAQRFFNTGPDNLSPLQSAVLVAMLKAPSTYDPIRHPELSLQRRNLVLRQMAAYGFLQPLQADSLSREPICLEYYRLDHVHGPATYFREHLRLQVKHLLRDLRKKNGMAYNLYTDGLKIHTTLDPQMQALSEKAVVSYMKELQEAFQIHLQGANPWEVDTVLILSKRFSARYQNLVERQIPQERIDSIFETPIDMTVFSWDGGRKRMRLSPMDSIRYYLGFLNAGLLSMEPGTGRVKAWVGGIDYSFFKYDHVKSRRQVGSTFKPVVYATALEQGISPCSYTGNYLRTYPEYENWRPQNATNDYGGSYSMEGGLINSINTVTVRMAMRAKPENVARLAGELGISGPVPPVPAIALGAIEASLYDMVTAYSTFANRGLRPEPYYLKRITTADGEVLLDFEADRDTCLWHRALHTNEADMINQMLRAAIDRGTGRRLRWRYKFTQDLAGKTGTSQHHSDGWFVGYTPALVTGVWVGAESPGVRFRNLHLGQGANTGLPIFARFFQELTADSSFQHYTQAAFPEPTETVRAALNCPNVVWPSRSGAQRTVMAASLVSNRASQTKNTPRKDELH